MKKIIKKLLPKRLIKYLRDFISLIDIIKLYKYDRKRLIKYAYSINDNFNEENLRAKITFHYHSIEKGLSNRNLRLGFGKRAFSELFWAMDNYLDKGYPTVDFRFQSAISVIISYVEIHESKNYQIQDIKSHLDKYVEYLIHENENIGGFITLNKEDLPDFEVSNFKELALNRYSIRDFGIDNIEDNSIFEAISIATKTPSVCNRQSWKVYYVKSSQIIKDVLDVHGGLTGNGENLRNLLLVTSDKQYMNGGLERNQTYIDGGLFTMSLIYALESNSIASCALNTNFDIKRDKEIRRKLSINNSEDLIAFIAIGSYPKVLKIAKSPRDCASLITTVIE